MNLRTIAAGFLLAAASCFAADIDGQWTGTMATPNGDAPITLTLKTEGAKLTGSSNGPVGVNPIADGKLDGVKISFTVTFDYNGMPITMNYKGVVAKDQIKFAIDIFGMPFELTVKKAV